MMKINGKLYRNQEEQIKYLTEKWEYFNKKIEKLYLFAHKIDEACKKSPLFMQSYPYDPTNDICIPMCINDLMWTLKDLADEMKDYGKEIENSDTKERGKRK